MSVQQPTKRNKVKLVFVLAVIAATLFFAAAAAKSEELKMFASAFGGSVLGFTLSRLWEWAGEESGPNASSRP